MIETADIPITRMLVDLGKSLYGGWSKAQLSCLGVEWPPIRGWRSRIEGNLISADSAAEFLKLTNKHLRKRP